MFRECDTSHFSKSAANARVVDIIENLDTGQFVLIPERTSGTRHFEGVPASLTIRLAHVELLAVVWISREAGNALGQVIAQGTLLCATYK